MSLGTVILISLVSYYFGLFIGQSDKKNTDE